MFKRRKQGGGELLKGGDPRSDFSFFLFFLAVVSTPRAVQRFEHPPSPRLLRWSYKPKKRLLHAAAAAATAAAFSVNYSY